jgi:hypothetical protein
MYAWIWRHLPFGLPGKIIGSVLLATALGALLWFQVFPMVEQYLPVNDGQITQSDNGPSDDESPAGDDVSPPPPGVIPYSTTSNNTSPGG